MMRDRDRARTFLDKEPVRRAAHLYALTFDETQVLAQTEGGVLLYRPSIGMHYLAAETDEAARALAPHIKRPHLIVNERQAVDELICTLTGVSRQNEVYNVAYTKPEPPPVTTTAVLRQLDASHLERVAAHYPMHTPQELSAFIGDGLMYGLFDEGEWCGFIGEHEDGSMGLLVIFPECRGKGYGYTLEALMIARYLAHGRQPFADIEVFNQVSLQLQRKLGMEIDSLVTSWLY